MAIKTMKESYTFCSLKELDFPIIQLYLQSVNNGSVQGQVRLDSEQPGLVEGVMSLPMAVGLE